MCIYYYLHHHHSAPCTRDIEFVIHYVFCPAATLDEAFQTWSACPDASYFDEHSGNLGIDFNNPCASGGCLVSPKCSRGVCRLEELNGLWTCCRCGLGGNTYPVCYHPMKKSPDSLCYHKCCLGCEPDVAADSGAGRAGTGR